MPEHKTLSAPYEPLRPPEYKRNELGQFSRPGKTLAKTAKKTGLTNKLIKKSDGNQLREPDGRYKNGGARPGAGRPKGSPNKVSASLKEMILQSLEELGGKEYLKTLAIENSSAYTHSSARCSRLHSRRNRTVDRRRSSRLNASSYRRQSRR